MSWPTPKNIIDVMSFMGLARYYRMLVEGFPNIKHQITYFEKEGNQIYMVLEM